MHEPTGPSGASGPPAEPLSSSPREDLHGLHTAATAPQSSLVPPEMPPVSAQTWRKQVEAELKGASFEKVLVTQLLEGLSIQPVYGSEDITLDMNVQQSRGIITAGRTSGTWLRGVRYPSLPLEFLQKFIQEDLSHGIQSLELRDPAALLALPKDVGGGAHMRVRCGANVSVARQILAVHTSSPTWASLQLGLDPFSELTMPGESFMEWEHLGQDLAEITKTSCHAVRTQLLDISTEIYHNAGAHCVQELAYALASGVEMLRLLDRNTSESSLPLQMVASQLSFTTVVGRDVFLEIAKLRALRLLWARVLQACGVSDAGPLILHAVTSRRTLTRWDPWVNMLRVTTQAFAAILGGADVLTTAAFDEALGQPEALGRRIARNTHTILAEESHLDAVLDPVGGSWYVESLTHALAQAAWKHFQGIEAQGGMRQALLDGRIQAEVGTVAKLRQTRFARRLDAITGVSEWPNPLETPLKRAPVQTWNAGLAPLSSDSRPVDESSRLPHAPFSTLRDSEGFEALRDVVVEHNEHAPPLKVYLACLGPLSEHSARTTFAQNVFWAGGLEVEQGLSASDADLNQVHAEAFRASGAKAVCLSGLEERYATGAVPLVQALKAVGATHILLAGRPGALEPALTAAGVSGYIYLGSDIEQTLHLLVNALLSEKENQA